MRRTMPKAWSADAPHLRLIAEHLEAVERGEIDRLAIHLPTRHGKPVYNKAMILMADGSRKALDAVNVGDFVITHEGRGRRVDAVHIQGELECVQVTTRSGRKVIAALDHPFLTPSGWVKAGCLRVGMVLANVPNAKAGAAAANPETFRLAGYFVGDGSTGFSSRGKNINAKITCYDELQRTDIKHCIVEAGFEVGKDDAKSITATAGVRQWLWDIGLAGKTSRQKRVPRFVFEGTEELVGHFVGAYFGCDGHINRRGNVRTDACVEIYSVNRDLLEDVQHLLLRLGVQSFVSAKNSTYNAFMKGPHVSWRLTISSQDDVARFVEKVPVLGCKMAVLADWGIVRQKFSAKYLEDRIVLVEPAGLMPCRCLTIEEDHTFTASDFVVHNSETVTYRLPVRWLMRNPTDNVLVTGYNERFARKFGRRSRNIAREIGMVSEGKAASDEWETKEGGLYMARGVGSPPTGTGFQLINIDDPIRRREDAESETWREKVWDWYTDDLYTRLEPGGAIVLVMTLWHADDLGARAVASEPGRWTVLKLPAFAEPGDAMGRAEGAALWPERYDVPALSRIRDVLAQNEGERSWQALYQQNPTAREGSFFKVGKIETVGAAPAGLTQVRRWDIAATANDGDYTAGGLISGPDATGYYYVCDMVRGRWATDERNQIMRETAASDGISVKIVVPQDPGAAGVDMAKSLVKLLAGYTVRSERETGAKETRADPFSAQVNAGNVKLVKGNWNRDFIEELRQFPLGKNDDQVDVGAGGFNELAKGRGTVRFRPL